MNTRCAWRANQCLQPPTACRSDGQSTAFEHLVHLFLSMPLNFEGGSKLRLRSSGKFGFVLQKPAFPVFSACAPIWVFLISTTTSAAGTRCAALRDLSQSRSRGHHSHAPSCPLWARLGLMRRSKISIRSPHQAAASAQDGVLFERGGRSFSPTAFPAGREAMVLITGLARMPMRKSVAAVTIGGVPMAFAFGPIGAWLGGPAAPALRLMRLGA